METTISINGQYFMIRSRIHLWGSKKPYGFDVTRIDESGRGIESLTVSKTRYTTREEGIAAGIKWLQSR